MKPKLSVEQLKHVQNYKSLKIYTLFMNWWNQHLIHWFTGMIFYSIFIFIVGLFFGENLFVIFKINFYIGYTVGMFALVVIALEEQRRKKVYKSLRLSRKDFLKALVMCNYVLYLPSEME